MFNTADNPVIDTHQRTPLGAGLANMPSLDISRKNDPWIFADDLTLMHMPQRPVVIAPGAQAIDCAGRIRLMPRLAVETGMQQPDIEELRITLRIALGEILCDCPCRKTLAVDGDTRIIQDDRFRLARGEQRDVTRQTQTLCYLAGGIMVAGNDEYRNRICMQTLHLPDKIEAGIVVPPVTVIEISGQQHESHLFVDRQLHQVIKSPARSAANLLHRSTLVTFEPAQGAVEMNVGCMYKFQMEYSLLTVDSRLKSEHLKYTAYKFPSGCEDIQRTQPHR